ncbi:hypothetical protein D9611_002918 [Ephemerocybe angulata]|uniref:CRAL-TRIO domain-containing protein n=1 Tax=Ephemerocybe angulata TaxID=980116 RepID=A0A8H5FHI7_9AGAR|nr:hypothetical protein D9611_002918 [Tulosesus angulatus]
MSAPEPASVSPMPEGVTDPNYRPPPGYLGNLTITQQHCLDKIKAYLKESGLFDEERHDDATLLRFCRARKFDFEATKTMIVAAENWRKEFGVDDIVQNFDFKEKAEVDKYYPQFYHKVDKDGRPLYIEQLGKLDIKALYAATTPERQLKRLVWEYEKSLRTRIPVCSRLVGHPVSTFCTILDLGGVSLSNFYRVKDYVSAASSIGQDRYPETMGKFYIINAPWAFTAIWSVVKGWLDPVTVQKIQILGGSYQSELLKQIEPQNLPKIFGGVCECPGGCSMSDAGPWNDPSLTATAAAPAPAAT